MFEVVLHYGNSVCKIRFSQQPKQYFKRQLLVVERSLLVYELTMKQRESRFTRLQQKIALPFSGYSACLKGFVAS